MTATFRRIEGQANKRPTYSRHAMNPGERMPIVAPSPWTVLRSNPSAAVAGLLVWASFVIVALAAMVMA